VNVYGRGGTAKGSLIAGVFAAIAASTCCVGPLLLLALGVSGGWIANLRVFEPARPLFIGLTLLFLGLAFRKLYLVPQTCATDAPCANPTALKTQRTIFWIVTVLVLALIAFPWVGPYFLE
jgi:mercuric ion transport protein